VARPVQKDPSEALMRQVLMAALLVVGLAPSAQAGKPAPDGSRTFSLTNGLKRIPQPFRPTRHRKLDGKLEQGWSITPLWNAPSRLRVGDVKVGDYVQQTGFHGLVQKVTIDPASGKHFIQVQHVVNPKQIRTFELPSGDDTMDGVHGLKRPAK
jgi:hypothetical protein